jgi:hypothetical protein
MLCDGHSTHDKDSESSAISSQQWCHTGIDARSHYASGANQWMWLFLGP